MKSSEELRVILTDLEASSEAAGAALIEAETAHRTAIRRSVAESSDIFSAADAAAAVEAAESALAQARTAFDRAKAATEAARDMLAEAVKREKAATQDAARAGIEAELADMLQLATDIDTEFAGLAARVMQLRSRELALRLAVRPNFGEVMGAPEFANALRSTAAFLRATADGLQPDAPTSVSKAAAIGAHQIRRVTGNA